MIFVGVGRLGREARRRTARTTDEAQGAPRSTSAHCRPDEPAAVDVWHRQDVDVMPRQKLSAARGSPAQPARGVAPRRRQLVPLGKTLRRTASRRIRALGICVRRRVARVRDGAQRSAGRPPISISSTSRPATRTKLKDKRRRRLRAGQPGRQVRALSSQDDQFWTINLATKAVTNITKAVADVVHRQGVGRDRSSRSRVRRRRLDEGRRRGAALRQVRRLGGRRPTARRRTRLTDGAAERVRSPRRARRSRRGLRSIVGKPMYVEPVRRLVEEVRLRAPRARRAAPPSGSCGSTRA